MWGSLGKVAAAARQAAATVASEAAATVAELREVHQVLALALALSKL
jgi:hypothetical protein